MHVLCVACIDHLNRVALDNVGVVPFVGVCHVVVNPSAEGWFAARQRALYVIDGKKGIVNVTLHVFIRVSVAVLLGHILVERPYLGGSALGIQVLILLHLRR